ncbi:MAG TPA: M14 family metallopeptidase [Sedimentisphaerales bacterium]|nr:M14 family metallopeptidase [Sedimentisphaerales bacterium]
MSLHFFRSGIKPLVFLFAFLSLLTMTAKVAPAAEYHNNKSLAKLLASLAEQNPDLMRVAGIARSIAKRKVWLVEVGKGAEQDRKTRPAMLVVAGIEGNDLVGSSIAVSWIMYLLERYETDAEITKLLQTTTFYVVPRLNPDAAEHFFNEPKCETSRNDKPVDDDHDGLMDEDGPEDLNGDGLITSMRIEDPEGEYILDPNDDRLLMKADPLKSEVGAWRYLAEGIDNDHDELWSEDGPGGVNFNRNFPYNFEFFASDAGVHQVSETETRALADFVIDHPNIGIILTYGAADNLLKTPKSAPPPDRRKPMTGIDEDDAGYYKAMGELYRKALGLDKELEDTSCPGTFSDWMYFHRGRLSLAARPWSPALAAELSKTSEKKEKDAESERKKSNERMDKDDKDDADKRNEKERQELKWFDEHAPQAFVKWQPIEHPDFPNQRVEVGGYSPFALTNPPAQMLEQITAKNADFLTTVAQRLPRIGIRKIETRHLGQSVYEVKIQVENTGFLPTSISQGQTTREVYPTRLIIELDDKSFLSGTRITNIPLIRGSGGMEEVRYIIRASDRKKINFEVISVLAGQVTGTIELTNAE